jgi:glycosyltransferase involved in cell wall biosynthesis
MRVAYLSVSDQLGGSEIALLEMIRGVRRARPEWPLHLILPGRGPLLAQAEAAGADCTVLPLPKALANVGESAAEDARWSLGTRAMLGLQLATVALSLPSYLSRLRRLLRSIDPDIVHSNGLKAHVTAARALPLTSGARPRAALARVSAADARGDARQMTRDSRLAGESRLTTSDSRLTTSDSRLTTSDSRLTTGDSRLTTADSRLIWHIHDYIGPRRVTRTLLKAHEHRAAAIIANSASVADDLRRVLSPAARVDVVHNAVDLRTFAPNGPVQDLDACAGVTPAASGVVRVGLVATFARWKGHEVFLHAIAALPPDAPVRAYVVGGALYDTAGSQYSLDELRRLARTIGVADRVAFTGFLPPAAAMRALDVVVHASTRPEPFGLVIAEAMACGRAVITSASGGAAELVEPEVDALTHSPGDASGLSRAIARLVADADLRMRLGARAREAACRRFDPDRLARDVVNVYEHSVY